MGALNEKKGLGKRVVTSATARHELPQSERLQLGIKCTCSVNSAGLPFQTHFLSLHITSVSPLYISVGEAAE